MAERRCPTCKQIITVDTGLHNWKQLFRWPSFQEWMIFFMLCMLLVMAYFYNVETQVCRETIKDLNDRGLLDSNANYVPINEVDFDFVYDYGTPNASNEEVPEV